MEKNDPIGKAILDFSVKHADLNILVESDILEEDVIPVNYLFRSFEKMPSIERLALQQCHGKILDVGAGAGPHTSWLRSKNQDVTALDTSHGAIRYLDQVYPNHVNLCASIQSITDEKFQFDTILMLMNGIGLAGHLSDLPGFLKHLKTLIPEHGKILCDSVDVSYLYEADDGGTWIDLNAEYQGDFNFKMRYKDQVTEWFKWLYVDENTFCQLAQETGFIVEILHREETSYLAELSLKL